MTKFKLLWIYGRHFHSEKALNIKPWKNLKQIEGRMEEDKKSMDESKGHQKMME